MGKRRSISLLQEIHLDAPVLEGPMAAKGVAVQPTNEDAAECYHQAIGINQSIRSKCMHFEVFLYLQPGDSMPMLEN